MLSFNHRIANTAIHLGARNGHKDVVKLLLDFNADVNAKNKNGMTPLQMAFSFSNMVRPA